MRIKKGDLVKIIRGKDKGKKGRVVKVFPKQNKLVVEGYNFVVKHVKPRRDGEKGQKIKIALPMSVSKVKLICPKCGKDIRVSYKILTDKRKLRFCKYCKNLF